MKFGIIIIIRELGVQLRLGHNRQQFCPAVCLGELSLCELVVCFGLKINGQHFLRKYQNFIKNRLSLLL